MSGDRSEVVEVVFDVLEEAVNVIVAVGLMLGVLLVVVFITELVDPSAVRDMKGEIVEAGILDRPGGEDIRVGDCLVDERGRGWDPDIMTGVPCAEPHDFEVFARFDLPYGPGAPYPDDADVRAHARAMCEARFAEYVGRSPASSALSYRWWEPLPAAWDDGDRVVDCWLEAGDGSRLEGSMRHGRR